MWPIEPEFDFEFSVVSLQDGRFDPLHDTTERWIRGGNRGDIQVLYQLKDGQFVLLRCVCDRKCHAKVGEQDFVLFHTMNSPEGERIPLTRAYELLVNWRQRISPTMCEFFRTRFQSQRQEPLTPEPRDPSHWDELRILEQEWGQVRFFEDAESLLDEVIEGGIQLVQIVREWDGRNPMEIVTAIESLCRPLFSQFPTDPHRWPGATQRILPKTVGIADVPWPQPMAGIENALKTLQNLVNRSLSVLSCAMRLYHPRKPTIAEPMRHPCFQAPDSILEKLRLFYQAHRMPVDRLLADLETTVGQLPYQTRNHEAFIVAQILQHHAKHRRTTAAIGDVLPAVLARLNIKTTEENTTGAGPEPA